MGKTALISRVMALKDVLGYQKGVVASRELIRKTSGTVTVFAFDKGEGLSEHTAPFDALVQILEGQARITISSRVFRLKKGEMIIMPAGKSHSLKAERRFKMLLTMVRG